MTDEQTRELVEKLDVAQRAIKDLADHFAAGEKACGGESCETCGSFTPMRDEDCGEGWGACGNSNGNCGRRHEGDWCDAYNQPKPAPEPLRCDECAHDPEAECEYKDRAACGTEPFPNFESAPDDRDAWERCGEWYETAGPCGSCKSRFGGNCVVEDASMDDRDCPKGRELCLVGEDAEGVSDGECALAEEGECPHRKNQDRSSGPARYSCGIDPFGTIECSGYRHKPDCPIRTIAARLKTAERERDDTVAAKKAMRRCWKGRLEECQSALNDQANAGAYVAGELREATQRAEAAEALNAEWALTFPDWERVRVLPASCNWDVVQIALRETGNPSHAKRIAAGPPGNRPGTPD